MHSDRKLLKSILRKRWLLWIFHHARVVMGTGDPAIQALQAMGCPANKIVKFPFFVDLGHYDKRNRARNDVKTKRFVSVGRVENAVKAHDLAIQAFARMQNNNDFNSEWEYIVVGSGPDVDNLRELTTALGLSDNVTITGWMEPNEVRKILDQAHVFVHPSLRDAYPAAVLEAMAVGLPVIGSNASGSVLDRIVHQENGLVHTAGDVSELSDHLEWSMINFEKIIDMGSAARVTAENWPVSKAIEIIDDVVNGQ
jgi:colanic acid/amylovoran biosynthesis glycosyltransferase